MAGIFTPRPGTGKLPVTGKLPGTGKLPPKPPSPPRPEPRPQPRPLPAGPIKLPLDGSQLKDKGKALFGQIGGFLNSLVGKKTHKKDAGTGGTARIKKAMIVSSADSGNTNKNPGAMAPVKPPKTRGPRTGGAQSV